MLTWIRNIITRWKQINEEFAGDNEPCDNGGCNDCACGFNSKGLG